MNLEILKNLREENNYTMQDLANSLKIAKSTYSLWEEGIERIPLERLVDICDLYHVSLDYILNNSKNKSYVNSEKGIDKKLFAENIKNIRKENKLTQVKFAHELSLNRTTIINYEKGYTLPLIDHILYLCKTYHVSADYLLGRIDNPKYIK